MKKIICIFSLLCLSNIAIADEVDFAPTWSSVAPSEYSNDLQYVENTTFAKKHPVLNSMSAFTIVGIPFMLKSENKSQSIDENNYWYGRKTEFENQVLLCRQLTDINSKITCFQTIRQNEQTQTVNKQQNDLRKKSIKQNKIFYNQILNIMR